MIGRQSVKNIALSYLWPPLAFYPQGIALQLLILESWYKRGNQVAPSVNTVIPLGPDCMSYQTLEFWEKGNEVFLVCSVGCISLYIALFSDNKKW